VKGKGVIAYKKKITNPSISDNMKKSALLGNQSIS
jgi:hypothetical protein